MREHVRDWWREVWPFVLFDAFLAAVLWWPFKHGGGPTDPTTEGGRGGA